MHTKPLFWLDQLSSSSLDLFGSLASNNNKKPIHLRSRESHPDDKICKALTVLQASHPARGQKLPIILLFRCYTRPPTSLKDQFILSSSRIYLEYFLAQRKVSEQLRKSRKPPSLHSMQHLDDSASTRYTTILKTNRHFIISLLQDHQPR